MKNLLQPPLNRVRLSDKNISEKYDRIGDNKRNPRLDSGGFVEDLIIDESPITVTCDVRPIHPPFFREFLYNDHLGGYGYHTMSAEVNHRMCLEIKESGREEDFKDYEFFDKYVLDKAPSEVRKVIFLGGSNYHFGMDQGKIMELMYEGDWYLKPHPVTTEDTIRDLAKIYGYDRILRPDISAASFLDSAEEVATTHASELFIMSKILKKKVHDINRVDRGWWGTYHHYCAMFTGDVDKDYDIAQNLLMSEKSGFLRPHYPEHKIREMIRTYANRALEIREQFRMLTKQSLTVGDLSFKSWN